MVLALKTSESNKCFEVQSFDETPERGPSMASSAYHRRTGHRILREALARLRWEGRAALTLQVGYDVHTAYTRTRALEWEWSHKIILPRISECIDFSCFSAWVISISGLHAQLLTLWIGRLTAPHSGRRELMQSAGDAILYDMILSGVSRFDTILVPFDYLAFARN